MKLKLQNMILTMVGLLGLISCSTMYHYETNNVAERKTLFTTTKYRQDGSKAKIYTSFTFGKIVYYEEFHDNGKLKTKGRYLKKRKVKGCIEPSKKKGKWEHWNDNGKLTYIAIYKKDTLFITEPNEVNQQTIGFNFAFDTIEINDSVGLEWLLTKLVTKKDFVKTFGNGEKINRPFIPDRTVWDKISWVFSARTQIAFHNRDIIANFQFNKLAWVEIQATVNTKINGYFTDESVRFSEIKGLLNSNYFFGKDKFDTTCTEIQMKKVILYFEGTDCEKAILKSIYFDNKRRKKIHF